ncbi:MAG: 50S ribosomal protein L10 [Candidatus Helarchaeales archaeon]
MSSSPSRVKTISPAKKRAVEEIKRLASQYQTMLLCRMEKMPSPQLQKIRKDLRGMNTVIRMAKNNIIKLALKDSGKKNIDKFLDSIEGSSALIFTNENVFKIKRFLDENKAQIAAKPGDIAPVDIVVPAGNTGFPPGAIISELASLGLKTRVQSGMIWIKEDKTVLKAGDVVDRSIALVLSRLGIQPITVGLEIYSGLEGEEFLSKESFQIDLDEIVEQLKIAASNARSLAVEISWLTPETALPILIKAHSNARNLIVNAPIPLSDFIGEVLAAAHYKAQALAAKILEKDPNALPEGTVTTAVVEQEEESNEEKKEEKEEKKEETTVGLGALFG